LRKLIVQAAIKIDEPKVTVLCREADRHLVEEVLGSAAKEASSKTKKNIDLSIDPTYLNKERFGITLFFLSTQLRIFPIRECEQVMRVMLMIFPFHHTALEVSCSLPTTEEFSATTLWNKDSIWPMR